MNIMVKSNNVHNLIKNVLDVKIVDADMCTRQS